MKLGNFKIHYLNGGITNIDGGAMFGVVPKVLWAKKYEQSEENRIPLPTHPILIQRKNLTLLLILVLVIISLPKKSVKYLVCIMKVI